MPQLASTLRWHARYCLSSFHDVSKAFSGMYASETPQERLNVSETYMPEKAGKGNTLKETKNRGWKPLLQHAVSSEH